MANLVLNPGFETWSGGTTFTFNSGTPSGPIADSYTANVDTITDPNLSAVISKDTVVFDTGLASCKVVMTDTNPSFTGAQIIVAQNYINNATAHHRLSFSIRVKADTTGLDTSQSVDVVVTVFNGSTQIACGSPLAFGAGLVSGWFTISGTVDYVGGTPSNVFFHVNITPVFGGFGSGTTATIWLDTLDMETGAILQNISESEILTETLRKQTKKSIQDPFSLLLVRDTVAVQHKLGEADNVRLNEWITIRKSSPSGWTSVDG
jgi:hypothetical protein